VLTAAVTDNQDIHALTSKGAPAGARKTEEINKDKKD